jgi:hypothetical protein
MAENETSPGSTAEDKAPPTLSAQKEVILPTLSTQSPATEFSKLLKQDYKGTLHSFFEATQLFSILIPPILKAFHGVSSLLSKRNIIILGAVCGGLALGAGSMALISYLGKSSRPSVDEEAAIEGAGKTVQKSSEKEKKEPYLLVYPYSHLPSLTIPIIQNEEVTGMLHLKLAIKSRDMESFVMCEIMIPQIVDRIFSDLFAIFGCLWLPSIEPKAETIKTHIMRSISKIVEKGKVEEVFIQEYYIEKKILIE